MVIGWTAQEAQSAKPPGSAWAAIDAAQRQVRMPCLLIPQPAHAVLAGELAAGLQADAFGALPPEVLRAIQMHDTGWAASDAEQIQRLRGPQGAGVAPVSFVTVSPSEAVAAWMASIEAVEALSKVGALIVSRHFSLLAQPEQVSHKSFLAQEKTRQRRLEGSIRNLEEAERWTAALGFCDLVSLYLLCGRSGEVEFPLAHPASANARSAPRVRMTIGDSSLEFTPETLRPGCILSIQGLRHPLPAQGARAETLRWEVVA